MTKVNTIVVVLATYFLSCPFAAAQSAGQNFASVSGQSAKVVHRVNVGVLNKINIRAVRYFLKTYPSVSNESWQEYKDGFVVKFSAQQIETKDFFDKKGNWLHCIRRYDESKLPRQVRGIVKSTYYDYLITQVEEITSSHKNHSQPQYLVHIQYGSQFKLILVYNDEMDEVYLK